MNFLLFGLFYLIYTLFLIIIGVVLYKFILKRKLEKQSNEIAKQLDTFFTNLNEEGDEFEKIRFNS